jgi:hypothetical protein
VLDLVLLFFRQRSTYLVPFGCQANASSLSADDATVAGDNLWPNGVVPLEVVTAVCYVNAKVCLKSDALL